MLFGLFKPLLMNCLPLAKKKKKSQHMPELIKGD